MYIGFVVVVIDSLESDIKEKFKKFKKICQAGCEVGAGNSIADFLRLSKTFEKKLIGPKKQSRKLQGNDQALRLGLISH